MVIRNSEHTDAELENASGGRRLIVRTRMAPAAAPMLAALWPSTRSFFPASLFNNTISEMAALPSCSDPASDRMPFDPLHRAVRV